MDRILTHRSRAGARLRTPAREDEREKGGEVRRHQHELRRRLEKLKAVRARIDAQSRPVRLEIDGGVKIENIGMIAAAGADTFVSGSGVFDTADYAATLKAMRKAIKAAR